MSRPKVLFRRDERGELLEPIEEVVIDVDEEHSGIVVQKMSERKAEHDRNEAVGRPSACGWCSTRRPAA